MALTAAERQRRCRLKKKSDTEKYEEYLRKARERYHKNKKLVKDMDDREKRLTNRKWRNKQKKRREKLKEQERLVDADTLPPSPPCSPNVQSGRKKIRRDRSKLYRENLKLETEKTKWKRKYEACKKKLQRTRLVHDKYDALCQAIKQKFEAAKSRKHKKLIKEIIGSDYIKQKGISKELRVTALGIRCKDKIRKLQNAKRDLRKAIQDFFLRDDVSRATAGKKETVTKNKVKKQKRFLLDTMKNLYRSFNKEFNGICSYTYFTRNRPYYVIIPSADARETCLCKLHTNIEYKLIALKKKQAVPTNSTSSLLESIVCNVNQMECMYGTCQECREKKAINNDTLDVTEEVFWWEWVRKTEEITKDSKTRKISKNVKEMQQAKLSDLVDKFQRELKDFKKHVFNVRIQHKAYRDCIENLSPNSMALHIDFSENYNCKHSQEIQAHHFGGSRNQLSLHTVVMYRKPDGAEIKETTSFCTVSSCLTHNPAAIWAHLDPILKYVNEKYPAIDKIHFFSDGPCTQYRQKQNFYLMTTKLFDYGFKNMTWSFFEAGHGKGAADGIGGLIKRTADRFVAHGKDITGVTQFYDLLKDNTNVKLFLINQEDIDNVTKAIPTSLLPIPATMRLHHIFSWARGQMKYSELSCFCKNVDVIGSCSCIKSIPYNFFPEKVTECMDVDADDTSYAACGNVITGAVVSDGEENDEILKLCAGRKEQIFKKIYYDDSSDSSDSETLAQIRQKENRNPNASAGTSLDKTAIHPRNIPIGTYLLIKIMCGKSKQYNYVGITESEFDDSEVKVTFLRCVDETKCVFRLDQNDVSFVDFKDIIKILDDIPSIKMKGKRVLYCFGKPVEEVFEK